MNLWRIIGWGGALGLWLLPALAMQFTREVTWTVFDFIAWGIMIGSVGLAFEFLARAGGPAYRIASGLALAGGFLTVWINLGVGIIGDEGNPANLMFFGVLAIGILGAALARFQPAGMARALATMAVAQLLIAPVALIGQMGLGGPIWPMDLLGLTGFFTLLWLVSAALYRQAGQATVTA